jgi:quinol monooxygenase YgiN
VKEIAMLIVLAEARFDPAQTEEVRAVARPMIQASRAEPGCGGASTMPSTCSSPT